MATSVGQRLEQYTIKHPQEVLIVTVMVAGEEDIVTIFRGFSSSLVKATAFDPDIPVLRETATILQIDRVASPYNPDAPVYLQQGITWEEMQYLLQQAGV